MKLFKLGAVCALAAALSACGGGVKAPDEVAGTWGADCTNPFVKFDGGKITVFPDKATYDLTSAAIANGELTVGYKSPQGEISEVYVIAGDTLRLDRGVYGGTEAKWGKMPMGKCAASDDG